jgi:hypothetical protein
MKNIQMPGLSPLWLIGLALVLGVTLITSVPLILSADVIKRADLIGFAGNALSGAMTLVAAVIAWFAVQRQIESSREIAHAERTEAWENVRDDLEDFVVGIEVFWVSVDHAAELLDDNICSEKRLKYRFTSVIEYSNQLPDVVQIEAIEELAKDVGPARKRKLTKVTFILRELLRKADDFGRGPMNQQPEQKWRSKRLGNLQLMLTIFERELANLDPSLVEPLTHLKRFDFDRTTRRQRLHEFWKETLEWEEIKER